METEDVHDIENRVLCTFCDKLKNKFPKRTCIETVWVGDRMNKRKGEFRYNYKAHMPCLIPIKSNSQFETRSNVFLTTEDISCL